MISGIYEKYTHFSIGKNNKGRRKIDDEKYRLFSKSIMF